MTALTARAAGVREVWVASPRPSAHTLAAAAIAGADGFLAVGGAQAVAAMTYGAGVPACDVIVGPGNRWVAAAKSIVNRKLSSKLSKMPSAGNTGSQLRASREYSKALTLESSSETVAETWSLSVPERSTRREEISGEVLSTRK